MEIPEWIDEDIIRNPMYWVLTAAAEFALIIGFRLQSAWSSGDVMPFWSMMFVLAVLPIASYFVTMKVSR